MKQEFFNLKMPNNNKNYKWEYYEPKLLPPPPNTIIDVRIRDTSVKIHGHFKKIKKGLDLKIEFFTKHKKALVTYNNISFNLNMDSSPSLFTKNNCIHAWIERFSSEKRRETYEEQEKDFYRLKLKFFDEYRRRYGYIKLYAILKDKSKDEKIESYQLCGYFDREEE